MADTSAGYTPDRDRDPRVGEAICARAVVNLRGRLRKSRTWYVDNLYQKKQ